MEFIIYFGYFFLCINTLLFTFIYKEKSKELKFFVSYLLLCFFIQTSQNLLFDLRQDNLFLSHYFFIGQFILLSLFFAKIFKRKNYRKIIWLLIPLIAIPLIYQLLESSKKFDEWSEIEIALTSIPLLTYSFLFFFNKLESLDRKYIFFNSGFFIYTLTSTIIFVLGNIGSRELKTIVWNMNQVLYLVFQILIFVEWFVNFRKPQKIN